MPIPNEKEVHGYGNVVANSGLGYRGSTWIALSFDWGVLGVGGLFYYKNTILVYTSSFIIFHDINLLLESYELNRVEKILLLKNHQALIRHINRCSFSLVFHINLIKGESKNV